MYRYYNKKILSINEHKLSPFYYTALQGLPFELNRKVFSDDLDVSIS